MPGQLPVPIPPGITPGHIGATGLLVPKATPETGVALSATTQFIVTATVPDDGEPHLLLAIMEKSITATLTGGTTEITWTTPSGTAGILSTTATAVGDHYTSAAYSATYALVKAGTVVHISQTSGVTAGAGTVTAKIVVI